MENWVKARFYIEPKEAHNRVQHIGVRLILTEKLIHAGFTRGMVFNLPDGTVEIVVEGNREDIEAFHRQTREHLIAWLEAGNTDKDYLRRMSGNPGILVGDLEYKQNLRVLRLSLYSHSLEMNQLGKGVDVYYDLKDEMKKNSDAYHGLKEELKRSAEISAKLSNAIDDFSQAVRDIRGK